MATLGSVGIEHTRTARRPEMQVGGARQKSHFAIPLLPVVGDPELDPVTRALGPLAGRRVQIAGNRTRRSPLDHGASTLVSVFRPPAGGTGSRAGELGRRELDQTAGATSGCSQANVEAWNNVGRAESREPPTAPETATTKPTTARDAAVVAILLPFRSMQRSTATAANEFGL